MNISNFRMAQAQNFGAKTIIEAPESLLKKEDRDLLIARGKSIGSDKDIIEIRIGELKPNKINSKIQGYDLSKKVRIRTENKMIMEETERTLPYIIEGEKLPLTDPKQYITKALDTIMQLLNG